MEILVELLLQGLWIVAQFIFEIVLQVIAEALFEVGVRAVKETFQRPPPSPALAAIGYLFLGAVAGGISLWVFPNLFIGPTWARWANLVLTPLAAGAAMAGIGWLRRNRGQSVIRLDTFAYGFLFALPMAAVRLAWGR